MEPISERRSLAQEAAERIREEILEGHFAQGQRLVEERLATELRISRGPVREALALLRAEGLVVDEVGRRSFVVRLSSDDVHELYDLRTALESWAVQILAESRSKMDYSQLRGLLGELEAAARAGDLSRLSRADLAFHDAICRLSGNSWIHNAFIRYSASLSSLMRLDHNTQSPLEIVERHRTLLEAIESATPEEAVAALRHHLGLARDLAVECYQPNEHQGP